MTGIEIHKFASSLWGINRSLTGEGNRETLERIKSILPKLKIIEVATGTQAFDWIVPREWKVTDAYIITPSGKKICSFGDNNLHLVGYSKPVHAILRLSELQEHLHSLPNQPAAIPYVTSYYEENWGFCISQQQRDDLEDGSYEVVIDSMLFHGSLSYGELFIEGNSDREVFISTYICHPSMANNELSGPSVTTFIAKWLLERGGTRYSYRIIFIPETIGSIVYLSRNKDVLKSKVFAGFNVSCVGDDREYSYLPSRNGSSISDVVANHVLKHIDPNYKKYKWRDRGSDERQYCSPGIDLPIASIMRSKYGEYPEYHTSQDDLINVVTPEGLEGGYRAIQLAIEAIEENKYPVTCFYCEPQLSRRGLYPTISIKSSSSDLQLMMDIISWSDGTKSMLDIAEICNVPIWTIYPIIKVLVREKLVILKDEPGGKV